MGSNASRDTWRTSNGYRHFDFGNVMGDQHVDCGVSMRWIRGDVDWFFGFLWPKLNHFFKFLKWCLAKKKKKKEGEYFQFCLNFEVNWWK